MYRKMVFRFLVLVFTAAFLAVLAFLPEEEPAPLEYSQIREIAAQDCRETDIAIHRGQITDIAILSDYTSELMIRAGYDPRGILSGEYSHLGNSYVAGTEYCWLVAFSRPGDQFWTVIYEGKNGTVLEYYALVH